MRCDECGIALFEAGATVPAGTYVRVDDRSFRRVTLQQRGPLPPSFDGHIAEYRSAAASCLCERHHASVTMPTMPIMPIMHAAGDSVGGEQLQESKSNR